MTTPQGVIFIAIKPSDRLALATTIERLIGLLDHLDGDADLEPEMGWSGDGIGCREGEPTDDREGDCEREYDEAERGIADNAGLIEQSFREWTGKYAT